VGLNFLPQLRPFVDLKPRRLDKSNQGFKEWAFGNVLLWGENPRGNWFVEVKTENNTEGKLFLTMTKSLSF
jgi:subtilisin-like proprotein convertase family protein